MAKHREGNWFAVPLGGHGYAVGLVARAPKRGDTLFGYFVGPLRAELPSEEELASLTPTDAVLVIRFLDEALRSGGWPILASADPWQRESWPMPEFYNHFHHAVTGEHLVRRYSEDDPARSVGTRPIAGGAEAASYPVEGGEYPPSHIVYALEERFGLPHADDDEERESLVEEGVRHFLLIPAAAVENVRRELAGLGFDAVEELDEREGEIADLEVFQSGSIADLRASAEDVEARLTDLAERFGGEYDGREWALPPA